MKIDLYIFFVIFNIKSINAKMKNLASNNKKLKKSDDVLKNTEILSFIKQDKLEKYIKFIIEKIKNDKEYSKLSKYLLDNWLKKS